MNKLQKGLSVFIFLLSIGFLLTAFNVGKVDKDKKEKIRGLNLQVEDLTKKKKDLEDNLQDTEKNLDFTKRDLEDTTNKLEQEKKKSASLQSQYDIEKERRTTLETDLNQVQQDLKQEKQAKERLEERLSGEIAKLKEEKGALSQDLNKVKKAKESLENFVAEVSAEVREETAPGRIIKVYPQGFLGIELKKGSYDRLEPGAIKVGKKEVKLSNIQNYMLILDVARGEELSGIKDGDAVEYKYYIRAVARGVGPKIE